MWEAVLPIIGFLIGLVSVMVGLGGGFLVVPLLTLVYAFSPANAVGTSLTTILMTTVVASAYFSKQKQTYYKMGLILVGSRGARRNIWKLLNNRSPGAGYRPAYRCFLGFRGVANGLQERDCK